MTNIGDEIRAARLSAGMTQEELAAAVGVSTNTVINWESGRHHPREGRRLNRLRKVLRELQQVDDTDHSGEQEPEPTKTPDQHDDTQPATITPEHADPNSVAHLDDAQLWLLIRQVLIELEGRYYDARATAIGVNPATPPVRRGLPGVPRSHRSAATAGSRDTKEAQ